MEALLQSGAFIYQNKPGEMAEWSIAAVLKTVDLRGSGGSNPSLSANFCCKCLINKAFAAFYFVCVQEFVHCLVPMEVIK